MRPVIKRIKKILDRNNGVSLIEVLVAVTILGIIAIPFSSVFIQTFKMSNDSNLKSIASQTAVKYMEKYKNDDSIPEQTSDDSGKLWIKLPTDDEKIYDSVSNLYVAKIIDKVDTEKYSTDKRIDRPSEDLFPPQSLYKITVKVYQTKDSSTEITSVSGLKRGKQ